MNPHPPLHLSAMPPSAWFFETFGVNWSIVELAWAKRAQLVRACEAQNWRCCYCWRTIDVPPGLPARHHATREHVIPKSRGGSDTDENIVAACMACNSERGTTNAYTYRPISARIFVERAA